MGEAFLQSFKRQTTQELLDGLPFRNRIVGQEGLPEVDRYRTASGDLDRIFQRLGYIGEQLDHLLRGAQILLIRIHPEPAGVI